MPPAGGGGGQKSNEPNKARAKRDLEGAIKATVLKNGSIDLEDVLQILIKLSLMNAEAIRHLAGAIYLTYLQPVEGGLYKRLAEIGQSYHDATVGKKPEEHKMGPPCLHMWKTLVQVCYGVATNAKDKELLQLYWEENMVIKMQMMDLAKSIQYFRLRRQNKINKGKGKGKPKGTAKAPATKSRRGSTASQASAATGGEADEDLTEDAMKDEVDSAFRVLQVRIEDKDLSNLIDRVLTQDLAAVKKLGSAPRSGLERAAQEILKKFTS